MHEILRIITCNQLSNKHLRCNVKLRNVQSVKHIMHGNITDLLAVCYEHYYSLLTELLLFSVQMVTYFLGRISGQSFPETCSAVQSVHDE